MEAPKEKSGTQRLGEVERLRSELAEARSELERLRERVEEQETSSRRVEQARMGWTQAFDALAQPVFIHDENDCIVRANRAYAEQAGLPVKNLVGKVYWKLFPLLDGPFARDAGEGLKQFEYSPSPDKVLLVQSVGASAGLPASWRLYLFYDITDLKRVESTLRASEQHARHVIDSSLAMIISADRGRRIVEFNRAAAEAFGYRREEVVGQHVNMLYADPAAGEAVGRRVLERDGTVSEIVNRRKNGELFTSLLSASTLRDGEGKMLGVVGTSLDISDRKRAEDKLNALLAELQLIFERAAAGVAFVRNGVIERVNPEFADLLGYKIHELIGKSPLVLYPGRPHYEKLDRDSRAEFAQGRSYRGDAQVKRKDGTSCWMQIAARAVGGEKDATESVWAFADIDERKKAEVQLERRTAYYRALVEHSSHIVSVVNAEGVIQYESPAIERLLGYRAAERIGQSSFEYVHPEDLTKVKEGYRRILEGETQPVEFEFRLRHRDGNWRIVEGSGGGTFEIEGGRAALVNLHDVAERRRHETRLVRSMEGAIAAIAATAALHDVYTPSHQRNVSDLAAAIGREVGLDDRRVHGLRLAALVHDIGMIQVPVEILAKPARVTEMERALIRTHPRAGYEILKGIDLPWPVADIVLQHHELLDATGYPQRLKSDQILLEARILAVADIVEAMVSPRPYRAGLGLDAALAEIVKHRAVKFDVRAVDACVRLFREKNFVFGGPPAGPPPASG